MTEPRVRITSDGYGHHTTVTVDGVLIPASRINWSIDARDGIAMAEIDVPDVRLDVAAYNVVKTIPDAPQITEVKRLAVQPGDVLVLEVGKSWTLAQIQTAEEYLKARFPGHHAVVIVDGTLKVASPDQPEL